MTYGGPERRDLEPIAVTVAYAVAKELRPVVARVDRLTRLIEGENGGVLNEGVVGAIVSLRNCNVELETRIVSVERKWDKFKWTITGAALGGGLAGGGLASILVEVLK